MSCFQLLFLIFANIYGRNNFAPSFPAQNSRLPRHVLPPIKHAKLEIIHFILAKTYRMHFPDSVKTKFEQLDSKYTIDISKTTT